MCVSFQDFDLNPKLLKAIDDAGFQKPSEIQNLSIPHLLQGKDIMASAPTGTGKTAAFVLPALQRLLDNEPGQGKGPRVLVLTPTRELAKQVADNIYTLTKYARMRSCSIVGGTPYPPQIRLLRQSLDLMVATPGRLIDHINSGRIDFSRLEVLVLDEADRMLDMGFIDDVKKIAALTPDGRQTVLFSATLEGEILRVAQKILRNPQRVQVAGVKFKHESITQKVHQVDDYKHKRAMLAHVLNNKDINQSIVFTATKKGADDLAKKLSEEGYRCAALHGDMKQNFRRRTIEGMQKNKISVLVATDVAARGLDIKGISHVINFDLPMQAEDYVHRIGRTGRGGSTGEAVSLVGPQDWGLLFRIEKLLDSKLELSVIDGLEPKKPRPGNNAKNGQGGKRKPNIRFKKRAGQFKKSAETAVRSRSKHGAKRTAEVA
jgi:superfamily II DNA/RNA helicase